ncbi:HAD-IIB family hydrolase [bacterium]|nr:HAD-IIB family hydrolase [bacterium]MCP5461918.1 HAD-IIB family hydrolase [bacterium]
METEKSKSRNLYIVLISPHGLIRSTDLELGRDADTGGQTKYVVQLAKHLSQHPEVRRVDLFTRLVIDKKVDKSYAEHTEQITDNAAIIRIPFGPEKYIRKELLWPYLDAFADGILRFINKSSRYPHIIHAHYADAGYVGAYLSALYSVPFIFTGHSLGREKKRHLLEKGLNEGIIERKYAISRRIRAEELALRKAHLVITNSQQEIDHQYKSYSSYFPKKMLAIPPGIDLSRFSPQYRFLSKASIYNEVTKFLHEPKKPMILCLSRPDHRKNIPAVLHAYGKSKELQRLANLILIIGTRDDIAVMESGPHEVWQEILYLIDRYDLYGKVAYPKQHTADDVPELYRIAARSRGVFINPALTEPFGLTLIEAAASGLPIVATKDGGPREIITYCKNGILVDASDEHNIAETLYLALNSKEHWRRWSANGIKGANIHYSWEGHSRKYIRMAKKLLTKNVKRKLFSPCKRLTRIDTAIISDIDNTLTGSKEGLEALMAEIKSLQSFVGFGVATGRSLEKTLSIIKKWGIAMPDLMITSVGAEIYYGSQCIRDESWRGYINYLWEPEKIVEILNGLTGLKRQPAEDQREHKLSYFIDPDIAPDVSEIRRMLLDNNVSANVIFSHNQFLDVLPVKASKGQAIRYLSWKWDIPLQNILVAGDSGNDKEMLKIDTMGVVVGNHSSELSELKNEPRVYFAHNEYAWGILEGMKHYKLIQSERPHETVLN